MARRKETVNQPSRKNQQYVNGRLNLAYKGPKATRYSAEARKNDVTSDFGTSADGAQAPAEFGTWEYQNMVETEIDNVCDGLDVFIMMENDGDTFEYGGYRSSVFAEDYSDLAKKTGKELPFAIDFELPTIDGDAEILYRANVRALAEASQGPDVEQRYYGDFKVTFDSFDDYRTAMTDDSDPRKKVLNGLRHLTDVGDILDENIYNEEITKSIDACYEVKDGHMVDSVCEHNGLDASNPHDRDAIRDITKDVESITPQEFKKAILDLSYDGEVFMDDVDNKDVMKFDSWKIYDRIMKNYRP